MTIQFQETSRSSTSLVEKIMLDIRGKIAARILVPGMKLPSIRKSAHTMQVSKSTIVEAYDRLVAEGIVEARKGSGFYVCGHTAPLALSELAPRLERAVDPLWVSRQSLEAAEDVLKPGSGWLPASWMPQQPIQKALRAISRQTSNVLTQYGTPHGFSPLRELIIRRMASLGIGANLDQVVLTDSGTQTIDLLCRFFIEPGDTVLVDDPCYFNFHALLKAHRVNIVSVPFTANGPDLELFQQSLAQHKPRLYITNSAIHNPTGAVLSADTAHSLLKMAEQSDLIIIEDDIFADLERTSAVRLAALDGLNRVVHIGSFSKTLSAAARCGYIAAPARWIEGLIDLKIATCFGGDPFAAELTCRVLKDASYPKHLDKLRTSLAQAMTQTCVKLNNLGIEPWIIPTAGMYVWCRLPGNFVAADIARHALDEDIILAPGNVFSLREEARHYLRFNVAQSQSPRIFDFLNKALSNYR